MVRWSAAGISPTGDWCLVTHDFMTASLQRANAERAYLLTDSSTFIVERDGLPNLNLLYRGAKELANPCRVLYALPATPGTGAAKRFGDFIMSERGQELMITFGNGRHGEPLYFGVPTM